MTEELHFKTIVKKIAAYALLMLIVLILPPPSLNFFLPLVCVGGIIIITPILALRYRSAKLHLLYHLGAAMYIFLFGLRCLDISIGLSWILVASLLPGLLLASLFPFVNKNKSEIIYQEETTPQTLLGRMVLTLALSIAPVIGVSGAIIGRTATFQQGSILLLAIGLLLYLTTVSAVHFGFHRYVSGRFEH